MRFSLPHYGHDSMVVLVVWSVFCVFVAMLNIGAWLNNRAERRGTKRVIVRHSRSHWGKG